MSEKLNFDIMKQIFEVNIPFNKLMGFQLIEIRPGFAQMLIPFRNELIGEIREKRMHGGVIMAAMDTAAGAACFTTIHWKNDKIATIDLRTDFLSPTLEENVIVEAEVRKSGSRVVFVQMKAYHPSQPEQLLSEGRATFSVKRIKMSE